MTLEQIRCAVKLGLTVHWKNERYTVHDNHIVCDFGEAKANSIGLTWSDGHTLNGEPEDFYVSHACIDWAVDTALADRTSDFGPSSDDHLPPRLVVLRSPKHGRRVIAVMSYLPHTDVDDEEATELAIDFALEVKPEMFQHEAEAVSNVMAVI